MKELSEVFLVGPGFGASGRHRIERLFLILPVILKFPQIDNSLTYSLADGSLVVNFCRQFGSLREQKQNISV